MPEDYFPPLTGSSEATKSTTTDYDAMRQWLAQQTVSVQKLVAGTIQSEEIILASGGTIGSAGFTAGSIGWRIDGDGSAEFNNVVIRGDLESGNWNGTSPANLATVDAGATTGFYLDSSAGAAQFEGDVFLGGDLTLQGGTIATDATSSNRVTMEGGIGLNWINSSNTNVLKMSFVSTIAYALGNLLIDGDWTWRAELADAGADIDLVPSLTIPSLRFRPYGASAPNEAAHTVELLADVAVPNNPELAVEIAGTEKFKVTGDSLEAMVGSVTLPSYSFIGDTDTGMYRYGANGIGFSVGNAVGFYVDTTRFKSPVIYADAIAGGAYAVYVDSDGRVHASTSTRKGKTHIQPADRLGRVQPVSYRSKADGEDYLGFIAEDVALVLPEAASFDEDGNITRWNETAILASIAARVSQLEDHLDL